MVNILVTILQEIITVTGHMAPYLLFGFGIAGILQVAMPDTWLQKHFGGPGLKPVLKGVLLGVPLPLCSCGVIGVSASLRRQGASRAAVTGFLIATPQTGVDSILATWGLLGPVLGVFRPIIAFVTGIAGGAAVSLVEKKEEACTGEYGKVETDGGGCPVGGEVKRGLMEVLRYGFVVLPRDIARPLAIGIVLSGLMGALLPQDLLAPYIGGGILAMVMMVAIGIPLYVCATASIPLAVGFIHLGASPGAALAFLIAGPATNAATVATVWNLLGKKASIIYVGTVAVGGVLSGLFFDMLARYLPASLHGLERMHAHGGDTMGWFNLAAAFLLAVILLYSRYGHLLNGRWFRKPGQCPSLEGDKRSIEFAVSGMRCENCARALTRELKSLSGVETVAINIEKGTAQVFGTLNDPEPILQAVQKLGYKSCVLEREIRPV